MEKLKFSHLSGTFINCILDNAKYQKSSVVQEYIANNPNVRLHYLPAYSPNLNLIERLWKFMHKHVTNNCYYEYFDSFRYSILSFLRNIDNFKDDLKTLITFKFQKLNYDIANFVKWFDLSISYSIRWSTTQSPNSFRYYPQTRI